MCITKILTLYGDLFSKDIVVEESLKVQIFVKESFKRRTPFNLNIKKISAQKLQIKRSIQSTK